MNCDSLYHQLESDFIIPGMTDDWFSCMGALAPYLCENFKTRSMGLVCDFASSVDEVYTAVFPSAAVMGHVLDVSTGPALLFVHHPMVWCGGSQTDAFANMDDSLLERFARRKIAIYCLHVPLDHYGCFSTTVSFARAIGIRPTRAFRDYFGAQVALIGVTGSASTREQRDTIAKQVGHECSLYSYGDETFSDATIAVLAGGGNDIETLHEVRRVGVTTLVTGITAKNVYSREAHEYAESYGINLIGATHYSSEKYACIAMTKYFRALGLSSEFISGVPAIDDL